MMIEHTSNRPRRLVAKCLFAAAITFAAATSFAAEAQSQLQRFVKEVQSATGSFTQQVVDSQGQSRQMQEGKFAFERPGRFSWHTLRPYEQVVVSDGKVLRQYDPDLAQVTERPVDESIGASPAAILFGSGSLEDAFELSDLEDRDGLAWLRATPRAGDAGFAHVDIGFAHGQPQRLELLDAFGQTTRIGLGNIQANLSLPADAFQLDVPADVDVVRMQ